MNDINLSNSLQIAYEAAVHRLGEAIEDCPEELWNKRNNCEPPFWQVAMHVLYYTRLFLCESDKASEAKSDAKLAMEQLGEPMRDWSGPEIGRLGDTLQSLTSAAYLPKRMVTKAELQERVVAVNAGLKEAMKRIASGGATLPNPMSWFKDTAFDLLLRNLRHIEYHLGQLASYLSRHGNIRVSWK